MADAFADRLAQIRSAPAGRKVAAFFDYDGTLIDGFSANAIYRDRMRRLDLGPAELARTLLIVLRGVESEQDFAAVLELNRSALAGKTVAEMTELGERLFKSETAALLRPQMWQIVRAHREMGHRIAIASSATRFQIVPIAREIDADHAMATDVEVVDGVLTGGILGRPLWGPGKAAAVRVLARDHDIDLAESFAYSDGNEDVPYLESVGHPAAVAPRHALRAEAELRGWPILDFPKPARNRALMAARTAAFYAGFVGSAAVGAVGSAVTRDPRPLVQYSVPFGSDLGLALAGVHVRVVRGREYLSEARPCVFVFNHQSKLDAPVLIHLLRTDVTGVAKRELRNVPVLGQLFAQGGMVFIDRADRAKAIEQLAPAVAKLRDEGVSLVMAPEGTRSSTPRVGPFKKGAFHIAMQAGVPVVPIVLRNTGALMWRKAQLVAPGTVEVQVLPPVDTAHWTAATVGEHAEEVRQLFMTTLADWPADEVED
jgi:putative phosphoserine phosphatase/1-acylglycerol-3-phosphate O-acyltransferase